MNFFILSSIIMLSSFLMGCSNINQAESSVDNIKIDDILKKGEIKTENSSLKLYWFIPDGLRADPKIMNIYRWADEGELPNIKKLMQKGSYGYSIPTFPSHTPTNFATLLTGTLPTSHGVADGPMHTEGNPLNKVSVGGFSSLARKNDAIWSTLEDNNNTVALISMPGSTPPELEHGITIRGRWGGWGADIHAINFESNINDSQRIKQGRGSRLFYFGPELTQYIEEKAPVDWNIELPDSYNEIREISLTSWGNTVYGLVIDSTNDLEVNYDKVVFSLNKSSYFGDLKQGESSSWQNITLEYNLAGEKTKFESHVTSTVIKLDEDGFFRIRLFYNNLNEYVTQPASVAKELTNEIGPMVDFVDNFPPQLIYYNEDKAAFIKEANKSLNWHKNAVAAVNKLYSPDIIIHDVYTPNQMLTSRWWMGYIDPSSHRYNDVDEEEREKLRSEVLDMYKGVDRIIGEIINQSRNDTYIVLSSDHGAVPLNSWVKLNNLFAKKGWLKFSIDKNTGEPEIDWKKSKVIYLKMAHIYINPTGLDGDYIRAYGKEYEDLRNEVIRELENLKDPNNNVSVLAKVLKFENSDYLDLPIDRVGDLIISNEVGYGWDEEMSADLEIFDFNPLKTGYKQAILANETQGMWTPFIISGPGIKENFKIEDPIKHQDQYPTILKALNYTSPHESDGKVLNLIFK